MPRKKSANAAITPVSEINGRQLYKVVNADAQAQNGGRFDYGAYLPNGKPGDWTPEVKGQLVACGTGYHLTLAPAAWWQPQCRIFVAEHSGEATDLHDGEKVACRAVRLVREVTDHAELAKLNIFLSGDGHTVNNGVAIASGSASVQASGSASVLASGSASVEASGSASVLAYDRASVQASGSASVEASGSASVLASGSASVLAYDRASVQAYDRASVLASGSASVEAYDRASVLASGSASVQASGSASVLAYDRASVQASGSASVEAYDRASVESGFCSWDAPTVKVEGYAVWVDRKTCKPRIHALATSGAKLVLVEPEKVEA